MGKRWHPVWLGVGLAVAAVVGVLWVPWVFVGVTAGFATSGST
ncbi:hypothetical protein [Actinokineospora terrae]|uniref:Uncharacterized protein n=1 Tax=Actinokineospora terrae TaxID=155974 RepID=A0A1H9X664_9PSEU|nr:hypothetical protein [Actinokineospora terrae]SES41630.1 hypothetical protein SAMN04487818_11323 [Actinokineospora terrae]